MKVLSWLAIAMACLQISVYPSQALAASVSGAGSPSSAQVRALFAADSGFGDSIDSTFGTVTRDAAEGQAKEIEGELQQAAGQAAATSEEVRDEAAVAAERAAAAYETTVDTSQARAEDISDRADGALQQAQEKVSEDVDFLKETGAETGAQIERTTDAIVEGVKSLFEGE